MRPLQQGSSPRLRPPKGADEGGLAPAVAKAMAGPRPDAQDEVAPEVAPEGAEVAGALRGGSGEGGGLPVSGVALPRLDFHAAALVGVTSVVADRVLILSSVSVNISQLLQQVDELIPIRVICHDRFPPITPCHGMIKRSRELDPHLTGHGRIRQAEYFIVGVSRYFFVPLFLSRLRYPAAVCRPRSFRRSQSDPRSWLQSVNTVAPGTRR
jgi:hypothetical protein